MKTTSLIIIGAIILTFGIFCASRGDYYTIFACAGILCGGIIMGMDWQENAMKKAADKKDKAIKKQREEWLLFPTQGELCEEFYDKRD